MSQAHFVYLLSQTWRQPFIYKALIPFSGKWGAESKHSTQFATGLVTAITFMICQSSAKSKYLHSFPPLPFFVSLGSCPYSLLLWVCGLVCLDYFFFLCCILDSFYCCTFGFTNLILQVPDLPFIPSMVFFISHLLLFISKVQFGSLFFFQFYWHIIW